MPKPTKPTIPDPPLRSNPDTFSSRLEASLLFWATFANYLDAVGGWTTEEADRATAAAALATGGAGLDLTGQAGKYLRVNAGETGTEFVARPAGDALEAANTGLVAKTAAGAVAPRTITAGSGISVTNGNGVAGNPTVSAVTRTQAQWNAGTDTTEATISPAKLDAKMIAARDAQTLGWGQMWKDVTASRTSGTVYQNTTGRPIMVSITGDGGSTHGAFQVSVNGTTWVNVMSNFGDVDGQCVVPNGYYYRQNGGVSISLWAELR